MCIGACTDSCIHDREQIAPLGTYGGGGGGDLELGSYVRKCHLLLVPCSSLPGVSLPLDVFTAFWWNDTNA